MNINNKLVALSSYENQMSSYGKQTSGEAKSGANASKRSGKHSGNTNGNKNSNASKSGGKTSNKSKQTSKLSKGIYNTEDNRSSFGKQ